MRRIILLILLVAFSTGIVKSQVLIALVFGDKLNTPDIEFGLNVGANFSTLANHPDAKYQTGLNLGLYFNFKLGDHLYLHPELQFMNQLGTRGVDNRDLPGSDWDDETLETLREINYFTLVFLPRYKLTNQLYFEAGIRGSYLLSADDIWMVKPEERSELYYKDFIRPDLNNFDVGVDAGLGFKFGKGEGVNLSLRYSHGFLNILRDSSEPAEYNRAFHVQVGIPIGVGKENVQQKLDH
jgi:hypothetical protein